MANEMRDRLKENISIIKQHNERGLPVKHITKGQKYEVEVIAEIVEDVSLIIEKLENKTLIELPCKVGDMIYRTAIEYGEVWEWDIVEIQIKLDEFVFIDDSENIFFETDIGKTVFLTKAEAEQKLREMRCGNE